MDGNYLLVIIRKDMCVKLFILLENDIFFLVESLEVKNLLSVEVNGFGYTIKFIGIKTRTETDQFLKIEIKT